jgi:hypothetical protein
MNLLFLLAKVRKKNHLETLSKGKGASPRTGKGVLLRSTPLPVLTSPEALSRVKKQQTKSAVSRSGVD